MADLFDRLFPTNSEVTEKISIHQFIAATTDYVAGYTTRAQVIAAWTLDAEAVVDLDVLLTAVDALGTLAEKLRFVAEFDAVMLLAEGELKYTTKIAFKARLGL